MPIDALPVGVFDWWDKAQHAVAFAVLAALAYGAYPTRIWRVLLGLLTFGGAIEVAQAETGWRYGEWADLLADGVGVCSVWLIARRVVVDPAAKVGAGETAITGLTPVPTAKPPRHNGSESSSPSFRKRHR